MNIEAWNTIVTIVLGGVLVAAIAGIALMYRQVGELRVTLVNLTTAVAAMTEANVVARREQREDNATIHRRIDDLARRTERNAT